MSALDTPPSYLAMISYGLNGKRHGSGVLVAKNLVLTCEHVLQYAHVKTPIKVILDRKEFTGYRLNESQDDLALVRLKEQTNIEPPPWWPGECPVNQLVTWAGFPGGEFDSAAVNLLAHTLNEIQIAGNLRLGASGGVLLRLVKTHVYCVGILSRGDTGYPYSEVIPESRVAKFLQQEGIDIQRDPPHTSAHPYTSQVYSPKRHEAPRENAEAIPESWIAGFLEQMRVPIRRDPPPPSYVPTPPPFLANIWYGRNGRYQGSGVLVAEDLVLTCEHVVENADLKTSISVHLGGDEFKGKRLEGSQEDDLALVRLMEPVKIEPPPWTSNHPYGEVATWNGFPNGKFEYGDTRIRSRSSRHLEIETSLSAGASGGVLKCLVGPDAYCVGILRKGGEGVPFSEVIPESVIAAFLHQHGVRIQRDPPRPPEHTSSDYKTEPSLEWLRNLIQQVRLASLTQGMLKTGGEEVASSEMIPESVVAAFLHQHGVPIRRDPPRPPEHIFSHYNTGPYLEWLRSFTQQLRLPSLTPSPHRVEQFPMDELYISLMADRSGLAGPAGKRPIKPSPITFGTDVRDSVSLEQVLADHRRLVIQGKAGSGKTTFLRYVARHHLTGISSRTEFPLFISVARLDTFITTITTTLKLIEKTLQTSSRQQETLPASSDSVGWIESFLQRQPGHLLMSSDSVRWIEIFLENESLEKKWQLDQGFFEQRLNSPDTVVLLDGLDEVNGERGRESITRLLEQAASTFRQCRWVVATRPSAEAAKPMLSDWPVVEILELEPKQIDDFLNRWSLCLKDGDESAAAAHCEDIRNALKKSSWEVRRLAKNPLMLSAFAVVHSHKQRLPDQRAELYECVVEWLAESRTRSDRPAEVILEWYGYLALQMQDYNGEYRIQMGRGKAAEILTERFKLNDAIQFLHQAEIDGSILTSEGYDVKFQERIFQEYLAARFISRQPKSLRWEEARPRLLRPDWRETFILLAGCLFQSGKEVLHEFMEQLLNHSLELISLAESAYIFGLAGAMLAELRAVDYILSLEVHGKLNALREKVVRIFDVDAARLLNATTRSDVADALARSGGDRRPLLLPSDPDYWVQAGSFKIGRYPVTVYEYSKGNADEPKQEPRFWKDQLLAPSRPVVFVSWYQVQEYCRQVGARLPTAAEWELVARGNQGREYPWGNTPEPNQEVANFAMMVGHATAVGLFPKGSTPEGVADMAGNVWEWTATDYGDELKAVRGGSFASDAGSLRTTEDRLRYASDNSGHDVGFRLIKT